MRIYMMGRVYASSIVYEVCEPCEKIIWGSGATYVAGTTEALVIEPPLDFVSPALVPPVPSIDPATPDSPIDLQYCSVNKRCTLSIFSRL